MINHNNGTVSRLHQNISAHLFTLWNTANENRTRDVWVHLCACACVHVCSLCMCLCVCVYGHACVCVCISLRVCACLCVSVYACLLVCVCAYMCVYMCVCVHVGSTYIRLTHILDRHLEPNVDTESHGHLKFTYIKWHGHANKVTTAPPLEETWTSAHLQHD